MRTALLTALVALAAAGALVAPASSATPTEKKLSRQVKIMQGQVKVLQGQVKTLRKQMRDVQAVAVGAVAFSACSTVATADAFQGTWETIDQINASIGQPDRYPAPAAIVDPLNSCQAFEVQRQANIVPPTTNVFAALLNIFR